MLKIFSMSFSVKTISVFERQAKRLMKKFPSLKKEIQTLISELKVVTHFVYKNETVYLLSIFDKSEMENLSDKEILELIKLID
jgi:hypothetical protein